MRHFYLSFLLLVTFSICNGQDKEIRIGLDIAPSLVKISEASGYRTSYSGGLNFEFCKSSKLSFKTGIYYESKGSKSKIDMLDQTGTRLGTAEYLDFNNYLVLPVIIKYSFSNPLYINAGAYCGYLLNNKTKLNDNPYPTPIVKKIDLGFVGGIGTRFHLTDRLNLNSEARINMGLLNINDNPSSSLRNLSYELLIGCTYKIK